LTVRALELAASGSGSSSSLPADGLVWVAVGSLARRELTPASIARGAVVCSDPPPRDWSESVSRALADCGMPGEVIARTPQQWVAGEGEDELALTVLVERRALWRTPRDPLPLAGNGARERVLAAAGAGVLSDSDARTLVDAFELALELRVSHHMEQLGSGLQPDDQLVPAAISPLTRDHLRDVFRAVAGVQRNLRR
jgi:signal-transduction protein with cAMP-binding, CBS, and nucleotidyltransferase domain